MTKMEMNIIRMYIYQYFYISEIYHDGTQSRFFIRSKDEEIAFGERTPSILQRIVISITSSCTRHKSGYYLRFSTTWLHGTVT